MTLGALAARSLGYYWRTNLATVAGLGIASGVLAGALMVGVSVRASLQDLASGRLGRVQDLVTARRFFDQRLAARVSPGACPIIATDGVVVHQPSFRRVSRVEVFALGECFTLVHDLPRLPGERDILLTEAVARELGASAGDGVLLRLAQPSPIPREVLQGRRDDATRALRFALAAVVPDAEPQPFSLALQQGPVRAAYVALSRLQRDLAANLAGQINALVVTGETPALHEQVAHSLAGALALEDLGVTVSSSGPDLVVESDTSLVDTDLARAVGRAVQALGWRMTPVLSYLANRMTIRDREIPYSLVTAVDLSAIRGTSSRFPRSSNLPFPASRVGEARWSSPPVRTRAGAAESRIPIVLNAWAASDLDAAIGDELQMEYFFWTETGRLDTRTARFVVSGITPIAGLAAARDLVPDYPGITDSADLATWDPPFPIDLGRIRPRDEQYWDRYRTTPKAFVPLEQGQQLWASRYGQLSSVRVHPAPRASEAADRFRAALRRELDPFRMGFRVVPIRDRVLAAASGTTDFGRYFVYFSAFLVASALLLMALFFRLGLEQRASQIGVLKAVGFPPASVRRLFWLEALVVSTAGAVIGIGVAFAFAALMVHGLRTWWVDAVGTRLLALHVAPLPLAIGAGLAPASGWLLVAWVLRSFTDVSARELMAGTLPGASVQTPGGGGRPDGTIPAFRLRRWTPAAAGVSGLTLLGAGIAGLIEPAGAFFGAGTLLLLASVGLVWTRLRGASPSGLPPPRRLSNLVALGLRSASHRPGRSALSIGLIGAAMFVLISVDAFRHDAPAAQARESGGGGYALMAEATVPIVHDLNDASTRRSFGLDALPAGVRFAPFRLREGDDTSCLNLYRPTQPRIVAAPDAFLREGRFRFAASMAVTGEERQNPWILLRRREADGSIPAIVDATSLRYVFHLDLGDTITVPGEGGDPVHLKVVATLADSVFQREVLIAETNFLRLFGSEEGYRVFLIETGPHPPGPVGDRLERALEDFGVDVATTVERLAAFHRVENTYLATFQALGVLGLLLGTVGLAAVLLRNVLERRRELALLRAVGFEGRHLSLMVLAEHGGLLALGILIGTTSALVAIAPALALRGGGPRWSWLGLIAAVGLTGLVASAAAARAALNAPPVSALKTE